MRFAGEEPSINGHNRPPMNKQPHDEGGIRVEFDKSNLTILLQYLV